MAKFTENQTAVLSNLDFSEGMWFDTAAELADVRQLVKDKKTARVVLNQLIKKGTLVADTTVEEGSTWLELKEAPEPWFRSETAPVEEEEEEEAEEDLVGTQDVEPGTPEDEVADAIAEIEAEEEDLVGDVATTHTENYVVREWTDADDVEWTEVTFPDKSHALKRRKKVNGAWRTDYWGAEFEGDKETYTTAKRFKMAKAYGSFTRIDPETHSDK